MLEQILSISKELDLISAEVSVKEIVFDTYLRKLCENNMCGHYGRNLGCPPYCGTDEFCIEKVKKYTNCVVLQKVFSIEDSFDIEGMEEAGKNFFDDLFKLKSRLSDKEILVLGAGGCKYCKVCSGLSEKECKFPENRIFSLESHCIDVNKLSQSAKLQYINGVNTVTYFAGVFFCE